MALIIASVVGCGASTLGDTSPASAIESDRRTECTNGTAGAWAFHARASADDGLVIDEARLGVRPMARRLSIPYLEVRYRVRDGGPSGSEFTRRAELTNGNVVTHANTLIAPLVGSITCKPEGAAAQYELRGGPPHTRLVIRQRYHFEPPVKDDPCEPTGTLECARFWPTARWVFKTTNPDVDVVHVRLVQRFDFLPDDNPIGTRAVFRDISWRDVSKKLRKGQRNLRPVYAMAGVKESSFSAVDHGKRARGCPSVAAHQEGQPLKPCTWDNYHQSSLSAVEPPSLRFGGRLKLRPIPRAGCPECVHLHWAWSKLINGLHHRFTDGKPLVPHSSTQTVNGAVVAFHPREVDPVPDYRLLVNGEPLDARPVHPVLFWDTTSEGTATLDGRTDVTFPRLTSRAPTNSSGFFAIAPPADRVQATAAWDRVRLEAAGWSLPIELHGTDGMCTVPVPAYVTITGGPRLLNPHRSYRTTPIGDPFVVFGGVRPRNLCDRPMTRVLFFDGDPRENRPTFAVSTLPQLTDEFSSDRKPTQGRPHA